MTFTMYFTFFFSHFFPFFFIFFLFSKKYHNSLHQCRCSSHCHCRSHLRLAGGLPVRLVWSLPARPVRGRRPCPQSLGPLPRVTSCVPWSWLYRSGLYIERGTSLEPTRSQHAGGFGSSASLCFFCFCLFRHNFISEN